MSEEKKEVSSYQRYMQKKKEELHNPKPPSEKEYVRVNEKGKQEYLKYVNKSYQILFFWLGLGGFLGYLNYTYSPQFKFLRNRPRFPLIRNIFTYAPICIFSYLGIKYMSFYMKKGAREVAKDPSNLMSE